MASGGVVVLWRFSDAKPGHDGQTRGLAAALTERLPVVTLTRPPLAPHQALWALLSGRYPGGRDLPAPDLVLGAGHATHLSMLAARRARGGRCVVLMRPSLPLAWFDLCLIPVHDEPPRRPGVIATRGVLNRIRPGTGHDPAQGLFLIGGPSAHFGWDEAALLEQIAAVVDAGEGVAWTLTTSRRTPGAFAAAVRARLGSRLRVVDGAGTGPDWLPATLSRCAQAWVSADSVSMVYEALTAGAGVGVLDVPRLGASRVARGLDTLVGEGLVTPHERWDGRRLRPPRHPFDEAARCAAEIHARWFPHVA